MRYRLTKDTYKAIFSAIEQCPADGSMQVEVVPYREDKTDPQHKLYFHWCGEISQQTGYRREEAHDLLKQFYLRDIYLADPKNKRQKDWVEKYNNLKHAWEVMDAEDAKLVEQIVASKVSITWALKDQMQQYLDAIMHFAATKGFTLSKYEDVA